MVPPPSNELQAETYHRGRNRAAGVVAGAWVAAVTAWAIVRWRPRRIEVAGASMAPTLLPGDWALAVVPRSFSVGDVFVVEHPGRPGFEMVKRIVGAPGDTVGERLLRDDEYWVEGDRPDASTDSRHFGPVTTEELHARVVVVFGPGDRRRRVR
jgi:inner membrane protease subunit 1